MRFYSTLSSGRCVSLVYFWDGCPSRRFSHPCGGLLMLYESRPLDSQTPPWLRPMVPDFFCLNRGRAHCGNVLGNIIPPFPRSVSPHSLSMRVRAVDWVTSDSELFSFPNQESDTLSSKDFSGESPQKEVWRTAEKRNSRQQKHSTLHLWTVLLFSIILFLHI